MNLGDHENNDDKGRKDDKETWEHFWYLHFDLWAENPKRMSYK